MSEQTDIRGEHVHIEKRGPDCSVNGLGRLVGYAIVEHKTCEPLAYLTSTSDPRSLVAQWDRIISAQVVLGTRSSR